MKKYLVTGAGSLIGQGIIKSIKKSKLKCKIIGTDYFSTSVGFSWIDKSYILPDILKKNISQKNWIDHLINIILDNKINYVFPGLDFEIKIISKYKRIIEKKTGAKIIVSDYKIINIFNDKWKTVNFLKKNNFVYPKSCLPRYKKKFLKKNKFPLIVKPRFGHTSKNVYKVNNLKELNIALENCEKPIIQEHIGNIANEYTCGCTCINNKVLSVISLRRILKNGNSHVIYSDNFNEIDDFTEKLTKFIKPYGPINFQLRITDKGPTIFEVNPRFSGTTPVRAIFGVNEIKIIVDAIEGKRMLISRRKKSGVVLKYLESKYISKKVYKTFK